MIFRKYVKSVNNSEVYIALGCRDVGYKRQEARGLAGAAPADADHSADAAARVPHETSVRCAADSAATGNNFVPNRLRNKIKKNIYLMLFSAKTCLFCIFINN